MSAPDDASTAVEGRTVHPLFVARLGRLSELQVALASVAGRSSPAVVDEEMVRQITAMQRRLERGTR